MSAIPTMFRRTAVRMAGHHHDSTINHLIDQGQDDALTNATSYPYGPGPRQIRQYDHRLCNLPTLREPLLTIAVDMYVHRHEYFRWTPKTAWATIKYVVIIPSIVGYIGYRYDVRPYHSQATRLLALSLHAWKSFV